MADPRSQCYIGVDVGTGSVRAGVVSACGRLLATSTAGITQFQHGSHFEQSSNEIWGAVCRCVREAVHKASVPAEQIAGIGFDATCSMVCLDVDERPVSISLSAESDRNVILWLDHRAASEAAEINAGQWKPLQFVGGKISLEMQTPKLLWLKRNLPQSWEKTAHFFDLPDFLTFRATGSLTRSFCSLVCKWTYRRDAGWDTEYFRGIDLEDLADEGFSRLGTEVSSPGLPVGSGLSIGAALDMGLKPGTPVGASLIDAHAGVLGVLGAKVAALVNDALESRLALIAGTSACHMALSTRQMFVPGVWGPYHGPIFENLWLSEGGQSAAGKLLDHVLQSHTAWAQMKRRAQELDQSPFECELEAMAAHHGLAHVALLTASFHVLPYFHGNRSPLADPTLKGSICGLSLSLSPNENLCITYLGAVQALALGTRHIVQVMQEAGHCIQSLFVTGGLSKNKLYLQAHADVLCMPVVVGAEDDCMLVGAAMLGARASGAYMSLQEAMYGMSTGASALTPVSALRTFYDKKFQVFKLLCTHQKEYERIMTGL